MLALANGQVGALDQGSQYTGIVPDQASLFPSQRGVDRWVHVHNGRNVVGFADLGNAPERKWARKPKVNRAIFGKRLSKLLNAWLSFSPNYENKNKGDEDFHQLNDIFVVIFSRGLCVFPLDLRSSCFSFGSAYLFFVFSFAAFLCLFYFEYLLFLGGIRQLPALLKHKPHRKRIYKLGTLTRGWTNICRHLSANAFLLCDLS